MQKFSRVSLHAGSRRCSSHFARLIAMAVLATQAAFAADPSPKSRAAAPAKPNAKAACEATHSQLDEAERQGHLQAAKELAAGCSVPTCGSWLAEQCRARFQTLSADIPTVVPLALDEAGLPIASAELHIDGAEATSPLNGPALPLDPGVHEFSFSAPGRQPRVEKLAILQGARNRQISVVLVAAEKAQPRASAEASADALARSKEPSPVSQPGQQPAVVPASVATAERTSIWPYVVGGVGLAALGSSVAFATWGQNDLDRLDRCAPNCRQSSIDHVRSMYIAADISLGVGALALGAATWLFFSDRADAVPVRDQALHLDVQPVTGGALMTVGQTF